MISLFKRPDTLSSSNQYSNNIWHFKFWRRRFLFIPTSQFTVVEVFVLNSEILVVYLVFPFLLYFTSTSWHLSDSSNYFRHLLNILYYKMTPKICWGLLSCVRCLSCSKFNQRDISTLNSSDYFSLTNNPIYHKKSKD